MEYRVPLIIALVVLLIIVFLWKRREGASNKNNKKRGKTSNSKGSKSSKGGSKAKPKSKSNDDMDDNIDDSEDDESEDDKPQKRASGDVVEDAKELYDLVHKELAGGMQIDAFEQAAGDLAGDEPSEVFVALKQKYTEAIDANRDPSRSVTVKDYTEILKKSG